MNTTMTLTDLNRLPEAEFIRRLGGIFEHSPWVAAQAAGGRPFDSVAALLDLMVSRVESANRAAQLALIQAHPELAGNAAMRGELTAQSKSEQEDAGLSQCSPDELQALTELNRVYTQKFGFPFILAVRGYDRAGIIAEFKRRIDHDFETERKESLQQIYQIARFRLEDLIEE